MVDVSAVEKLGYTVEVNTTGDDFPYIITGKRGASYGLFRNVRTPHMLFAVNRRKFTASALVAGYTWFSDKDGKLVPVN